MVGKGLLMLLVEMILCFFCVQKMDVLSFQVSLVGYVMMMQVVNVLLSILFMMMMFFGIIKLVKVFIIGVGVVGL